MADDLGYNELGCYGQEIIRTPNIDKLAKEGMSFTNFYSGSPVCAPSRCVLMTGMHTGHSFIRDNGEVKPEGQRPIPDSVITIAEVLKANGYTTGAMGKWGLGFPGSEGEPNKQGFDYFYGYNCQRHAHNHYPKYLWRNQEHDSLEGNNRELYGAQYSQDLFVREAKNFILENEKQPFFLYLPFIIPHVSIQVPDESLNEYKDSISETPYKHNNYYLEHPYPHAGYAAMITHMDKGIGEIVHLIDSLGLAENTLIIFTSDNGPTYGRVGGADSKFFESANPFRGLKGNLHEGGVRIPLIARWPGKIKEGTNSDYIGAFQDVFPTLKEVSGDNKNYDNDGISFLPTLVRKGQQGEHEYLYWEFPSYGGQQSLRWGSYKLIRKGLFKNPDAAFELYDLSKDIGEENDIAAENPEIVEKMKKMMEEARVPSLEFPFAALDEHDSK